MLNDIVLWLFVIFGGISAGAGLYEMRVNVPRWFTAAAGSGLSVNVDRINTDDSGRRFWGFVTTLPLTLLTIASIVIAWNPQTTRAQWWLAGAVVTLAERFGTFGYFIPTLLKLMKAGHTPAGQASQQARLWVQANRVRVVLSFTGWLAALKALSLQ